MKWLADECFDNDIIRGLFRRFPDLDLIRAQDVVEIAGREDEKLLAWATKHERIVLTHDLATMAPDYRFNTSRRLNARRSCRYLIRSQKEL